MFLKNDSIFIFYLEKFLIVREKKIKFIFNSDEKKSRFIYMISFRAWY